MPRNVIDALRRANRTRVQEDSVWLRSSVLIAVLMGVGALLGERAISPSTAILATGALVFGYWVSYRRRADDNWHIKIVLAAGAIFALARFFSQVGAITTLDEARFPLAEVFLWVQVLHGFDLPARRDLYFSLGASLTLMAVAGSISQDVGFGLLLVPYAGVVLGALMLGQQSELIEGTLGSFRHSGRASRTQRLSIWRSVVKVLIGIPLAAVSLFLLIPQPTNARTFALPFSFGGSGSPAGGGILNPGFSGEASARSAGASYFGLSQRMDLRVRGQLSDELVMRVRSSAPAMWKGAIFDGYDGVAWTGDYSDPVPLGDEPPYAYPPAFRSLGPRALVTQTYYLEAEQPNTIFAAGQPDSLWFDGTVSIDELGALRTSSTLTEGTVYSVASTRGSASPSQLRRAPDEAVPEHLTRYLQLPADLPQRVSELARDITAGKTNDYDRVRAIEDYLRANYKYTIDSPIPPFGQDAVDHFLFEAEVGFCEQFASATAVLLRSLGVPTRVVTGYAVGERNVFTGYYDVKASDAHAWVEVWFPRLGWYEFDPTFDVPPAEADLGETVPLVKLLHFVAERLEGIAPGRLETVIRGAVVLATGAALAWTGFMLRRRGPLGRRGRSSSPPLPGAPAGPVSRAFLRLETSWSARGLRRDPSETAREFAGRAARLTPAPSSGALDVLERERFAPEPPSPGDVRAAERELERLASPEPHEQRIT